MSDPKFPTPEEIQSKLAEFMKSNFGNNVSVASIPQHEKVDTEGESGRVHKCTLRHLIFIISPVM